MGIERFRLKGFGLSMAGGAIVATLLLPSQRVLAQVTPAPETAYEFNLPGGDLAKALDAFSMQAGIQIGYAPELVAGRQARALDGRLGWREGLGQLLQGSGLVYQQVNDGTILIQRSGEPRSSAKARPTATSKNAVTEETAQATELQGISVTGTRIRGGATPSPVTTISVTNIREEGFSDLGEVIRSVPQNFSGGQNPEVPSGNLLGAGLANQNITGGSGLNLRGLGPDASLTLLNGRRMSYGGFSQAVDISAIPVDVVDRVEIVADGASAIYGSDAVGGVGNVILAQDFDGMKVGARYGGATDGGLTTREYTVTGGHSWATGGFIAAYKYVSVDPIYAGERDYTDYLTAQPRTIYPGSHLRSGLISLHQALGDAAELRIDALRSERGQLMFQYISTAPQYYQLKPETTATFVAPSLEFALPNDWTLSIGGSWGKDEHVSHQALFVPATGASTLQYNDCYCNTIHMYEVGAEGPMFALPGGDARLAVGAGHRANEFVQINYLTGARPIEGDESSRFAYAEIDLPLIGSASASIGAPRLSMTAAVRGEDYSSFGGVTTPKLGLIYRPGSDVTLKATWGRSFKAPTLFQRNYQVAALLYGTQILGGTGYPANATAIYLDGGNRDLEPERARTWTSSLAFHPIALPNLLAELTWFDVDYTDRVIQPIVNATQALSNPLYAPFVNFAPTVQDQSEVLANAGSFINSSGAAYDPANVVAIVYARRVNAARQRIRGADLSSSYWFDLADGRLTIRGSASWLDSSQQSATGLPNFDLAGTLFNPAEVNSRFGVVWDSGGFSYSTFANYTSGVKDTATGQKGGSLVTFDGTLRYAMPQTRGVWSGLELVLSAQNLLDREPPLYTPQSRIYSLPYDPTNYSAVGRFLSLSVAKQW